ncbi:MAG: hypothetical protein K1X53_04755 [Candidatus Sumerlaeaceae bacterium]|nr:hypothetical protein [Candidatus Sumerlaeaceae bacterium]
MATRKELQQELADLDRQINAEVAKAPLPKMRDVHRRFPFAYFILGGLGIGYWAAGDSIPGVSGSLHTSTADYGLYVGGVIIAIGVIRLLQWMFLSNFKADAQYKEATVTVKDLQQKRRELQQELKNAED